MSVLRGILARAASQEKVIVLSEGEDARVVTAAVRAREQRIARIILLGADPAVRSQLALHGGNGVDGITVIDPVRSELLAPFASEFFALRHHKGVTEDMARQTVRTPLYFAALMVRNGLADGTVGGAVATTADTVRAALTVLGRDAGSTIVSSFFLMIFDPTGHATVSNALFADCALIVEPNAEELAQIAGQTARSLNALTGQVAKVAMLSFSTAGSATHPRAAKVADATRIAQQNNPALTIDGEMQFDAAFAPEVAKIKMSNSAVAGHANVFVFPNLDAGNIGYKIAQRLGGATAIGPILQGLAMPANDLSRGCSAEDVFNLIAVTSVQAQVDNADADAI